MWRNDRDRPDDPHIRERETQRLARDEYDRPLYGNPTGDYVEHVSSGWNAERPPDPAAFQPHRAAPPGPTAAYPSESRQRAWAERSGAAQRYRASERNFEDVRVHELMTQRVTSVHPATPVERAARLMEECDCGALPVVGDNGVLVGMITDRDIAIRIVARGREPRKAIVADCMTEQVFGCYAHESVGDCMRVMARHQVRRMPIVDDRGRLVGIIAQGDLARHAGHHPVADERRALTEVVSAVSQPTHAPYR